MKTKLTDKQLIKKYEHNKEELTTLQTIKVEILLLDFVKTDLECTNRVIKEIKKNLKKFEKENKINLKPQTEPTEEKRNKIDEEFEKTNNNSDFEFTTLQRIEVMLIILEFINENEKLVKDTTKIINDLLKQYEKENKSLQLQLN